VSAFGSPGDRDPHAILAEAQLAQFDIRRRPGMLAPEKGRDPINESDLRPVAAELNWRKQRRMWRSLRD
jgi:hypothetical protein